MAVILHNSPLLYNEKANQRLVCNVQSINPAVMVDILAGEIDDCSLIMVIIYSLRILLGPLYYGVCNSGSTKV